MTISRVKPSWAFGDKLTAAQMDALDENTVMALDKRAGQTDTLASNITITGDTLFEGFTEFDGNVQFNDAVSCEGTTTMVGTARIAQALETIGAGRIIINNGNYIEMTDSYPRLGASHTGRTVTRRLLPARLIGQSQSDNLSESTGMNMVYEPVDPAEIVFSQNYAVFNTVNTGSSTGSRAAIYDLNDVLIDGSTLTTVNVQVKGAAHTSLPARLPRIRVGRLTPPAAADVPLHSAGSAVVDTSANTTAYALAHTIAATCNQNNTIDKSQYHYYLVVYNEGGTNAETQLQVHSIALVMTITDLRPA